MLNPRLLNMGREQYITGDTARGLKWSDVNNQDLKLKPAHAWPARRVCGLHACAAIEIAVANGWVAEGSIEVPEEAYASEDCDEEIMKRFLNDQISSTSSSSSPTELARTPSD